MAAFTKQGFDKMKKRAIKIIVLLLLIVSCGCTTTKNNTNTITQTSTIDALLAGSYDGNISCGEILEYGDFGLGTFDRLDGEMIALDGVIYQVKIDGNVYKPNKKMTTPFAAVCKFEPDKKFLLETKADYKKTKEIIDKIASNKNMFYAIKIKGEFSKMKVRSVPAQNKPYRPLAQVAKEQAVFELENIDGTIVGFKCPAFVKGLNVPGYHLHFISDDFKKGGHILDFTLSKADCELDVCHKYFLILPDEKDDFANIDLSQNRSEELEAIEN